MAIPSGRSCRAMPSIIKYPRPDSDSAPAARENITQSLINIIKAPVATPIKQPKNPEYRKAEGSISKTTTATITPEAKPKKKARLFEVQCLLQKTSKTPNNVPRPAIVLQNKLSLSISQPPVEFRSIAIFMSEDAILDIGVLRHARTNMMTYFIKGLHIFLKKEVPETMNKFTVELKGLGISVLLGVVLGALASVVVYFSGL
jgi:hypothetical protein